MMFIIKFNEWRLALSSPHFMAITLFTVAVASLAHSKFGSFFFGGILGVF